MGWRDKSIGERERNGKVPNTNGKKSERRSMGQVRASAQSSFKVPQPRMSSDRCRETHEMPWTQRCVLHVTHVGVPHKDKFGNEWGTSDH